MLIRMLLGLHTVFISRPNDAYHTTSCYLEPLEFNLMEMITAGNIIAILTRFYNNGKLVDMFIRYYFLIVFLFIRHIKKAFSSTNVLMVCIHGYILEGVL